MTTASVEFSASDAVVLTDGSKAAMPLRNLIGGRYLELLEGAGGTKRIKAGGTIGLDRTAPALDLDARHRRLPAAVSRLGPTRSMRSQAS